jgi:sodium transport system ATP-binding protein
MIEVEGLTKEFTARGRPPITAVDDLRFTVNPGEVFGLLGPNGAGKTTLLRMLCTVLRPTAGFASVAGFDVIQQPNQVRRHVGFLSANTGVYDRMTAWEMVEYYGRLYGLSGAPLRSRLEELFESFHMNEFRHVLGGKLSTGMRQKVSIARALVHDPPVLIFDEPTNGLDVLVQRAVIRNISHLRGRGKTILFSSHIMSEVEKLCDRVAILTKGKIVACGTLDELRKSYGQSDLEELFFNLVSDEKDDEELLGEPPG